MQSRTHKLVLLSLVAALAACSSAPSVPTRGDRMMEQASAADALGKKWNQGSSIASKAIQDKADAERSVTRAEKELKDNQAIIADATQRQADGERMMAESEAEYARQFPGRALPSEAQ